MSIPMEKAQSLLEKIRSLPVERVAEVEDFVDFLRERTGYRKETAGEIMMADFPVISVGKWPDELSLRREDMYGDDGR